MMTNLILLVAELDLIHVFMTVKYYQNAPSLGFIVGDEPSGNYFGKQTKLYFNNVMSDKLKEKFESKYETDISIVNKRIYNDSRPNVFLKNIFVYF